MEIWLSNPLYLWLLVPLPLFIAIMLLSLKKGEKEIEKIISPHALEFFFQKGSFMSNYLERNFIVFLFRALIYVVIVFVISGAVFYYNGAAKEQGIVIAIDASGSMLAEDLSPNRLDAVKETISVFLEETSPKSKIALLSFSGNAYVEQKLSDKEETIKSIENLQISEISGTSIGIALRTAANVLDKEEKPKLVILISDGSENILSKQTLNEIIDNMNKEHITVNVIGIGSLKGAKLPGINITSELNEPLLEDIAKKTGGIYSRAETKQSLKESYEKIISSTKLKIPIRLTFPLILFSILLLSIDYLFIKLD